MCTHYLLLPRVSWAEGGSEGGRARLAVPRHIAGLRGAADGQGVNAVGVAIAITAVLLPASITRGPHKDGSQATASLWYRNMLLQKVLRPLHNLFCCGLKTYLRETFADVLKNKSLNLSFTIKFRSLFQYFIEALVCTSFSHLSLGSLSNSSWQILPSSVRLDGKDVWAAIFWSLHRFSMGFCWATQGQSETCPRATPALSWLYTSL